MAVYSASCFGECFEGRRIVGQMRVESDYAIETDDGVVVEVAVERGVEMPHH